MTCMAKWHLAATSKLLILVLWGVCWAGNLRAEEKVFIYAAASMTGAVQALVDAVSTDNKVKWIPVFGASSTLARQISQGAPAHIYISAHPRWMDDLAQKKVLVANSRVEFARNQLVLATGLKEMAPLDLSNKVEFRSRLEKSRFAMADPAHVPAGIYAEQALKSLGLWDVVKDRLVISSNARITRAYLERAEASLGVLYRSDLTGSDKISALATFPARSHDPIIYTAALVRSAPSNRAQAFMAFLQSEQARAILNPLGFKAPETKAPR